MEMNKNKLSGALKGVTIFLLVVNALSLLVTIIGIASQDMIESTYKSMGIDTSILPTTTDYIVSIILCVAIIVFLALILNKNTIGVYGYYIVVVINLIYTIVINGFHATSLLSLIFPIVMFFLIRDNKEILGLSNN